MRTQQTQSSGDSVPKVNISKHQPVLLQEVIYWLDVDKDDTVFDGTLGGGGHASALAVQLGKNGVFIGTDVDSSAITKAKAALVGVECRLVLTHTNFKNIKDVCKKNGITHLDKVLLDLGWSSDQIIQEGKGLSFLKDEPLSMRLSDTTDEDDTVLASDIVNEWAEESIADILYGWGGERYSRRIAKAIVETRKKREIKTTFELAEIIRLATPRAYNHNRLHSATRTFQALRIAVNDEIRTLQVALKEIKDLLSGGGKLAVISFHSGEDRVVKHTFKNWVAEGEGEILTKKPIIAGKEEIIINPRARSAKLRIFKKT